MSGRANGSIRNGSSLRAALFEAACDVAVEAEVEAAVEAALARYDADPEPPMIGFRMANERDADLECESCAICQMLAAEYEEPELVPLPDGSVLELRRHRSARAVASGRPEPGERMAAH